ncbi:hypothetical protein SKAU_G00031700 [Synaphobranchus kaupii]|uniref:Uncharacterized protein n=1 Tax=Synaphobranchus kaupii TaxID=118154 RepID=A0A9Q1JFZ5_SYNKA|nr:hypothetical protein SKAU_G00031700 [Synaphobranchus kaupii]
METTGQSAMEGDSCTQLNQKNDQPEMTEMQKTPLEFRSTDSQLDFILRDDNCAMDRNTMKIYSNVQPAANKEAIEHMLVQSGSRFGSWKSYQVQARDQSRESIPEASSDIFTKPVEVLDNSVQMSRVHSNRKRDHSSGTRNGREPMRRGEDEGAGLVRMAEPGEGYSTVKSGFQTAEGTNETRVSMIPLYVFQDSSMPLLPRSVLRSSTVNDSESSSETVIKKRKIRATRDDTRRVRFAEQPVFLPDLQPLELNTPERLDQPSLHTWILALKGKSKWKPRH